MALQNKIQDKSALVGVIGLGYVGLPLVHSFHGVGLSVIGFDSDPAKIEALQAGQSYIEHIPAEYIAEMNATGRFRATDDFDRLGEADAILICVPTPLGLHLEPDLSYVEQTAVAIARTLRAGQLIVLESTTYPGTTRDVVKPILDERRLSCGRDYFLAYSPEREDPGRKDFQTQTIPKLVGGIDATSGELAVALYELAIEKVVPVSSAEVAEAAKLLENIYRAVNIAMVNEMKVVLTELGVGVWEAIDAAATKPFGFQRFTPGPGLGGALHSDRSVLPDLAGAGGGPADAIHRTGRRSQPRHARLCHSADHAGAEPARQVGARCEGAGAGPGV